LFIGSCCKAIPLRLCRRSSTALLLTELTNGVPISELLIALGSFLLSVGLLAGWLRYGIGRRLIAIPNARSSHSQPTLTAGGVVIVLVMVAVLLGYFFHGVDWAGWLAFGCLAMALIGFVDDLRELSPAFRLLLQSLVVALLLWTANAIELSQAGWPGRLPTFFVALMFAAALVWFVNLFNFMDGIDGLATMQSASYCLAALFFMVGDAGWYSGVLWSGAACSLGFAVFNLAPARIFMGDVGSGFWGLVLGVLALQLAIIGALPLTASLVLLSAFWFDASYTLITRMLTGQRFTQGHRSHLYQRLADRWGHARTTFGYAALFLLWQWPLAAWIRSDYLSKPEIDLGAGLELHLWWIVVLACMPLVIGCIWCRAGQTTASKLSQ